MKVDQPAAVVVNEPASDTPDPIDTVGPMPRPDGQRAYGQWETVVVQE